MIQTCLLQTGKSKFEFDNSAILKFDNGNTNEEIHFVFDFGNDIGRFCECTEG
jgi:hypothetical protein